jgi:hypothetical protein
MELGRDKVTEGLRNLYGGKNSTTAQKFAGAVEIPLGAIQGIFTVPMAMFKGAENLPGVGYAATTVNSFFAGLGSGGAGAAVDGLYALPLSQKTKQELEPTIAEIGSLVSMIAGGKLTHSAYTKAVSKIDANLKTFIDKTKADPAFTLEVKSATPDAQSVFLDRFRYDFELPTIDWGTGKRTNTSGLPIIDIGVPDAPIPRIPGMKYVPETGKTTGTKTVFERYQKTTPASTSDPRNFKTADEFVARDPVKAEVAMTTGKVPEGLYVGDVYKALEAKAIAEGNVGLIQRLANTTVGTEAARGLKAFDRPTDGSINLIQELRDVRAARTAWQESMNKGLVIEKEAAKLISQAEPIRSPKIKDWQEFIKSLEC